MLATVLFGSCNLEDTLFPEQECETEKEAVNVRLILSMMEGRGLSRAPLTDNPTSEDYLDEEPLGNEYYINPYDVEVLIFNANTGVFVERATMVRATPTDNYHEYQLDGTLTEVNGETNYHVVLLANLHGSSYCNNFTTPTTGTTMSTFLEGLTYTSYNAAFTGKLLEEDSTERIPMWGITTTTLQDGITVSLDLLRAMAKVKVVMEDKDYSLSGATLNIANKGGSVAPFVVNGIMNGKTNRVRNIHIPNPAPESITQELNFTYDNKDNGYVIFIPEYNNRSETEEEATIALSIKDANGNSVDLRGNNLLYFRNYSEVIDGDNTYNKGEKFDIIRNYYYHYTVTKVNVEKIEDPKSPLVWYVNAWRTFEEINYDFN